MIKYKLFFSVLLLFVYHSYSQTYTGVFKTVGGNTDYHHFVRNGNGAAVYINQASTDETIPILRLSSGTSAANQNIKLTVENNGNVGFGTINPIGKLHIVDTGTIGAKWNPDNSYVNIGGGLIMDPNEIYGMNTLHIGAKNGDLIKFLKVNDTGHDLKMIIKENGNVGIGTPNPGSWKLAVNGQIRAKEIKVDTDWSDFVFEKNYALPTLQEVEQHIKEKGHLQDIPSAEEVEENGIYLGEMDAKLLQKIEELTLYTLQQEEKLKEMDELKKRVELLEEHFKKYKIK
ncbi:hypothetical protein OOZ15_11805 [Galbibacter sp. EGI 63066]|uniref:hypothetical protein n=1 Tax=Galbibacter sp. EGI 63066 TaxID=2993559 RepID=UPI002248E862|nr:hypothetical protein [Galbibacter sp. EGI 63066]MCX2680628.1 hypothetical protein [Galbibacter sp. EGI 63066]